MFRDGGQFDGVALINERVVDVVLVVGGGLDAVVDHGVLSVGGARTVRVEPAELVEEVGREDLLVDRLEFFVRMDEVPPFTHERVLHARAREVFYTFDRLVRGLHRVGVPVHREVLVGVLIGNGN